jgi:hypothetical protein
MYTKNAFQVLFTLTLAGLYFFVTGIIGWQVRGHNPIVIGGQWIDGPAWVQVGVGLACFGGALLAYTRTRRDPRLQRRAGSTS